jgi:hypothetical protein
MKIPEQLKDNEINLEKLKKVCNEYLEFLNSDDYYEDNDYDHYIYEAALKCIYGDKIFDFINSKE